MNSVKTLKLGHSGLHVSTLCLGTLMMGTKVDRDTSFAILDGYYEAGGRFLDTANNYSKWHARPDGSPGVGTESEATVGEWLTARNVRGEMVIATKVGFNRDDVGQSVSRKTIESEIEGSLTRLQTDYVDLYYAHTDNRSDPLGETLSAFDGLVKAGKVHHLGCSNYLSWRIEEARQTSRRNGGTEYCCVQQRFTYLRPKPGADFGNQRSANNDLIDYCREHDDFRMLAYSPLLSGAYSRQDKPIPAQYAGPDAEARLAALQSVAKETGSTVTQAVYAWLLAGDPAIIPITAPTSLVQLNENLGGLAVELSPDQMDRLNSAGA